MSYPTTVRLEPKSVQPQVLAWHPQWRFKQFDNGRVSFNVQKECGLVVTLGNECGYPQSGYAAVIDKRGSNAFIDISDRTMSTTYIADATNLETPLNASFGLTRNVELCASQKHRIDVVYSHGMMAVFVDGNRQVMINDTMANPGLSYIGFGTTGIYSGPGVITDLKID